MKLIFITGGVLSSVGKGILSGSLGALLEARGHRCTCMKLDPYVNVDPGTIRPSEHGEVYVTSDGAETDLDLGHYERFISAKMSEQNSVTTGKVYSEVIRRERQGDYLGSTVQVVPHVTNHIQELITRVAEPYDITLIEVGGTVGDIESLPFLEAIRQMKVRLGGDAVMFVHLTWLPYIPSSGELKTKPTQHSVKELRSIGIQPDVLVCRSQEALTDAQKDKIAMFTNVSYAHVLSAPDVDSIYQVPLVLSKQGLGEKVESHFKLESGSEDLSLWHRLLQKKDHFQSLTDKKKVGIIGKYISSKDAYKSLDEALLHASIELGLGIDVIYIDADQVDTEILKTLSGIVIPGGFGRRGVEGKMRAIEYARKNKVPFLGICLGMQLAVIEFCRNVLALSGSDSTEMNPDTPVPVVGLIEELVERHQSNEAFKNHLTMGGTMRLGSMVDDLVPGSKIASIYAAQSLTERHRHRYEVNPEYITDLEAAGMLVTGVSSHEGFVDVVELKDHPWFVGCQFHPEFTSKPLSPSLLFLSFVKAVCGVA